MRDENIELAAELAHEHGVPCGSDSHEDMLAIVRTLAKPGSGNDRNHCPFGSRLSRGHRRGRPPPRSSCTFSSGERG